MKKLIVEADVKKIIDTGGKEIVLTPDTIVTPSALDLIIKHKLVTQQLTPLKGDISKIIRNFPENSSTSSSDSPRRKIRKIAIGSDHTGYRLKEEIKAYLQSKGYEILDCGTDSEEACDYPDFAYAVSISVKNRMADRGIILDATGIPSAICANKVDGIRAAVGYNEFVVKSSREHNDSNVVTFGARIFNFEILKSFLQIWLETNFDGGRHQRRLDKIKDIELKK